MTLGWRQTVSAGIGLGIVCWLGLVVSAAGVRAEALAKAAQAAPAQPPQMSDAVFKNIQILKGIPVDQFMDAMGMFSASLGYDCSSCHSQEIHTDRAAFAITTPLITRARQMMAMMNGLNEANFGGRPRVTCFTCHRGSPTPEDVPSLALQYSELMDDPNAMAISRDRSASADQVFGKYIQALGGAQRLASLTSFVARGTYAGFNTGGSEVPIEIAAKAPNQRTQVVRGPDGDAVKTYDGRNAWVAEGWRPLPLMELTTGNLDGARLEALASFPASIKDAFRQWQVGAATIDDHPVQILQGTNPGQLPVNFYFDESGLLVRIVRWNRTVVGTVPAQIDYADYRDVAGVKMPFRIILTWTDGQNTTVLSEVRPNVAIEAARFSRPAPFQKK
jgi:hypothetical protein